MDLNDAAPSAAGAELDSIPISALQHFAFCPRQCALIHIERAWEENHLTAEGRVLHERAHDGSSESRRDCRIARSLPLQSDALRLHGVADIVEFHRQPNDSWHPFPVEYKRGRPKVEPIDKIQLCAQAICLEEMLGVSISAGAIFYGASHRRHDVLFDAALRAETHRVAALTRAMIEKGRTPAPEFGPKCRSCSLLSLCQPGTSEHKASAHLARLLAAND